jgi:hypothetical protein
MLEDLDKSFTEFVRWSIFFGVIYFSYKSRGFRMLGWLIGGLIITIALYRTFFTVFLSETYWFFGLCILASCYFGRKEDEGKPNFGREEDEGG